jgi:hypothetical protein
VTKRSSIAFIERFEWVTLSLTVTGSIDEIGILGLAIKGKCSRK